MPTESKWDIIKASQLDLKAYKEQMKRYRVDLDKFASKSRFGKFEAEQVRQIGVAMLELLDVVDALKAHIVNVRKRSF